jgi:hypothetical protein
MLRATRRMILSKCHEQILGFSFPCFVHCLLLLLLFSNGA